METPSTQERILLATIECVEEYGLPHVTTRKIAEKAGVNVAAINYYFRSKERLLEEAMRVTIRNSFEDARTVLQEDERPAGERLRRVMEELFEGGFRFPRITQAHLYTLFTEGRFAYPFQEEGMRAFFQALIDTLAQTAPHVREEKRRHLAAVLASAVFMPFVLPPVFELILGKPIDEEVRKEYLETVFELLTRADLIRDDHSREG
ncbi:hypothetical protein STHERM_c18090 [Spirochaeta thermophila DSM 6192]|uniref:HTH tetR-type domain-containing protein n=1 Tax=Winmispira thermophila (strain ATCC 49972 / DSM 6192 / RI 19.B1) TaxID=665571 RepID=E0RPG2_WINT6|nr:hypothetical protein STHERM_c18090 [Spirochaeta thermophila DSM 6192]